MSYFYLKIFISLIFFAKMKGNFILDSVVNIKKGYSNRVIYLFYLSPKSSIKICSILCVGINSLLIKILELSFW